MLFIFALKLQPQTMWRVIKRNSRKDMILNQIFQTKVFKKNIFKKTFLEGNSFSNTLLL